MSSKDSLFKTGEIGPVEVRNRIIRAGTSESTGGPAGEVTQGLIDIHRDLAVGGVGLAFSGHMFVHPRGRYGDLQTGIHTDSQVAGLAKVTSAVHRNGGKIFAQLGHAGSQSMIAGNLPVSPSAIPNVMTGRMVAAATSAEIEEAIQSFASAARRAAEAGFDGVHIHGANGYLISEFRSPITNKRTDEWGGTQSKRERFPLEVIKAVRAALPSSMGLTMKVGLKDLIDETGGLDTDSATRGAKLFVEAGLDGIEVSSNLMSDYVSASIRGYVGVGPLRAFQDLLFHRVFRRAEPEAYFLDYARHLRREVDTTIILVGGLRRIETMSAILDAGDADFLSLARPFIREPDLVRKIEAGRTSSPACVSCNICIMHDEHHSLRCWRTPRKRLLEHAVYRLSGGFKNGSGKKPSSSLRGWK